MGTRFESLAILKDFLLASCYVPFIMGLFKIIPGRGWYIDGLLWPTLFVPWRCFGHQDRLIRVSVMPTVYADVRPKFMPPPWWAFIAPKSYELWGLFWQGYLDMAAFYEGGDNKHLSACCVKRAEFKQF